jgi:hypothetical protein
MDAVDGEIEARRARRPKKNGVKLGELGVVVFAWVRPNLLAQKVPRATSRNKHRTARATPESIKKTR